MGIHQVLSALGVYTIPAEYASFYEKGWHPRLSNENVSVIRERCFPYAVRLFGPDNAEDELHEALLKVNNWLLRGGDAKVRDENHLSAIVCTAIRNRALDRVRPPEDPQNKPISPGEPDSGELQPVQIASKNELVKILRKAVDQLPQEERQIVWMHDLVEGMTFQEIARLLERPASTVKDAYRRALERLREKLRAYGLYALDEE